MKKETIFLFLIFSSIISYSQNVGIGTTTPDSSAALEIKSSSQGFLPPRITTTQRNAIANPAEGLQIFNTTTKCLQIFAYGFWQNIYCAQSTEQPSSLTNGLVAYYPFNGNANHESGNGNNGVVNGATLTMDRLGNIGNAYSFDGINDLISIAHSNAQLIFGANQNSTISLWVKKSNYSDVDVISKGWHTDAGCTVGNQYLGLGYANPPNAYNFMLYDGDLSHLNNWRTNSNPNDTLWHNLIIIRAAQPKFYLDGIESTNIISNLGYNLDHNYFLTNSPLTIGARNNHDNYCNVYYNYYFAGKIDDIRLYNRALTQEEITYLATH